MPLKFFVLDGLCHGAYVIFQPLRGQRAQQGQQESLNGLSHEMNNLIFRTMRTSTYFAFSMCADNF
jgi:hypothetical protein